MSLLWMSPVTDRTMQDVNRAKELNSKRFADMTAEEKVEYLAGLKGALNREDLLRVENNIRLLADVLELDIATYEDAIPEFPTTAYYNNLLGNVEAIREAYVVHADTPSTPNAPLNTYGKWNEVEKILADVHECLDANFYYYCGSEIYAGDTTGLLL